MKKSNPVISPLLVIFIIMGFNQVSAFDSESFSVKLYNFSKKIFREDISKYRLTSSNKNFSLIESDFQRILDHDIIRGEKSIVLQTGNIRNSFREKSRPYPEYLRNTRFLNLNTEEIKNLANHFKNSRDILSDIEHFVCNHITHKTIGIPLLPAINILKNKTGDCTEHTILTLAILRSLNIPSRAVVGMILTSEFEDKKNVFIFHMWAEANVNNRWHLVDSANPGKKFPNRYIAFTYHSLRTEIPLSYLKAVSAIQDLKVRYIN